jgi:hypothetical protein
MLQRAFRIFHESLKHPFLSERHTFDKWEQSQTTPALRLQAPGASPNRQPVLLAIGAWSLLIYPPGCAAHGRSQERLSSNNNNALVLQAAINISLQLLIAHISKLVHALALYAASSANVARAKALDDAQAALDKRAAEIDARAKALEDKLAAYRQALA